jgi:hypothetical protein
MASRTASLHEHNPKGGHDLVFIMLNNAQGMDWFAFAIAPAWKMFLSFHSWFQVHS